MDSISADSGEELSSAYQALPKVFSPYKFEVQQLNSNNISLQAQIDEDFQQSTEKCVKLLGLTWDRMSDEIFTRPIKLDGNACTKRTILKSIASQFDIYNFNLPLLNRSRMFMHTLQCDKDLEWDKKLKPELQREWKNICKQANSAPEIKVPRFVGSRKSTYKLLAYTDASRGHYGAVVYILEVATGKISFVLAKNRLVNIQFKLKSIQSLELNAINLGVEILLEIYRDLSGPGCLSPIRIEELLLFTDSICYLYWLNSFFQ